MASLLTRNSVFYASFYDVSRSPKEKRISLRTKNKSTARQLLARFERLWLTGEADPWQDDLHAAVRPKDHGMSLTLDDAFGRFLQSRREMNATANTLRSYQCIRRGLLRHASGTAALHRLTASQLRSYILAEGIAVSTRQKRYTHVRAFLRWSIEQDYLKNNPLASVAKPKADKKLPVPVTAEDLRAVTSEIKAHYRTYRKTGEMQRGHLLWKLNAFWIAFYTGLRRSEIARLRWKDVDLTRRTLTLRTQKNRREERLPMSKKAASILERIDSGEPEQFVFRSPSFTATKRNQRSFGNNLSRTWLKFRRKAGLREAKNFHALRKGFCSQLAKSGASAVVIKRAARHADISTSMVYVALHDDSIRSELDAAF